MIDDSRTGLVMEVSDMSLRFTNRKEIYFF